MPAVVSGRRAQASDSSVRGAIRKSSFSTTSVTSPIPRSKTAACSKTGVSMGRYPYRSVRPRPTAANRANRAASSGRRSRVPRGTRKEGIGRSLAGGIARLPEVARDADDVLELLDATEDAGELADGCDLEGGMHDRHVVRPDRDARREDVDLGLGDDLGDVAEEAGPVVGLDPDGDGVGLRWRRLPLDLDEPADLALVDDRRAGAEVDGHALAPGDEALDRVARDRMAAAGEADEEIPHPLDPHPPRPCRLD